VWAGVSYQVRTMEMASHFPSFSGAIFLNIPKYCPNIVKKQKVENLLENQSLGKSFDASDHFEINLG